MNKTSARILIIEDDQLFSLNLKTYLVERGFHADGIVIDENVEQGIKSVKKSLDEGRVFNLVVIDCELPNGKLGLDAAKMAYEYYKPYILFVTGHFNTNVYRENILKWEYYSGDTVRYHSKRAMYDILDTIDEMFTHLVNNILNQTFQFRYKDEAASEKVGATVFLRDILGVAIDGNKLNIYLQDKSYTALSNFPLKKFIETVNGNQTNYPFLQISRDMAINIAALEKKIYSYELYERYIQIQGNKFYISERYYADLKKRLNQ